MAEDLLSHETCRHAVVLMQNAFYAVDHTMFGFKMATL
jgi:hypothetical protein